jgi:hypothetical protein
MRHAQVSFIEHVCIPFFFELQRVFPAIEAHVAQMRKNLAQWEKVLPLSGEQQFPKDCSPLLWLVWDCGRCLQKSRPALSPNGMPRRAAQEKNDKNDFVS